MSKFIITDRAIDLMKFSMNITSNRKHYPNKHIMLVRRIQDVSMRIYENISLANELSIENAKSERLNLQDKAIAGCKQLSCYIEMSLQMGLIGSENAESWQELIRNVEQLTKSWRSKDALR